jgi:hypothetical protein
MRGDASLRHRGAVPGLQRNRVAGERHLVRREGRSGMAAVRIPAGAVALRDRRRIHAGRSGPRALSPGARSAARVAPLPSLQAAIACGGGKSRGRGSCPRARRDARASGADAMHEDTAEGRIEALPPRKCGRSTRGSSSWKATARRRGRLRESSCEAPVEARALLDKRLAIALEMTLRPAAPPACCPTRAAWLAWRRAGWSSPTAPCSALPEAADS